MGIAEELRWTAAKLMKVGKFVVDSAVMESLRGGLQVYTILRGKLKGHPPSDHLCKNSSKKQHFVVVEEMHANLEKMHQDLNNLQHQTGLSTPTGEEQDHHLFHEPLKKKIFIRSRL